jgi:hypothetical protein
MLIITPYGRLGNNIIQLYTCIFDNIHKYNHKEISMELLIKKQPDIFKNFPKAFIFDFPENNIEIKDIFYYNGLTMNDKQKEEIINKYIKPYISYDLEDKYGIDFDEDLIIHIRSGDIFKESFPLTHYTQPPYIFYKKVLNENIYKKIYICSENFNLNPVIKKLLEEYSNVVFLPNSLEIDFKIMLNAQHFVTSNSSLSYIVNLLSTKKKIFSTGYGYGIIDGNCKYNIYRYPDYYKKNYSSYDEKINTLLGYTE